MKAIQFMIENQFKDKTPRWSGSAYGRGVTIVRIAGAKPLAACGGRVSAIGYFCGAAGGPAGAVPVPGVGTTTPGASGGSSTAVTRLT